MRTHFAILLLSVPVLLLAPQVGIGQETKPNIETKAVKVEELVKGLKADDEPTRLRAFLALADLGPRAEPALEVLLELMQGKNEDSRLNAAIVLGKIGKAAIPPLSALLDSADAPTRFYAIWSLGGVGPEAKSVVPALIKALDDKDAHIRRKAAYALGRIASDPEAVLGVLKTALGDDNEDVRSSAADALARFGAPAVPPLTRALEEPRTRLDAARALGQIGADARDAVPALRDRLLAKHAAAPDLSETAEVHHYADALAGIGKAAIPALIGGLRSDRPEVRQAVSAALTKIGAEAVPSLVDALGDKQVEVRRIAAQTLAPMRIGDKMVVIALSYSLKDSDDQVRQLSVQALAVLGNTATLAVPALREALADYNPQVRQQAFYLLQNMGENPREALRKALDSKEAKVRINTAALMLSVGFEPNLAIPILSDALEQKDAELRMQAAFALAQHRREIDRLVPLFTAGLKEGPSPAKLQAIQGLTILGPQAAAAAPSLVTALRDDDARVRTSAIQALQSVRGKADEVLAALAIAFKAEDVPTRQAIVQTAGAYGDPARSLLLDALKDEQAPVRQQAVYALQQVRSDLSAELPILMKLVKEDPNPNVRVGAIYLLARGGEAAIPNLVELLSDKNDQVRLVAMQTMQGMGSRAVKAVPAIAEMLRDKNLGIRNTAIQTLFSLGGEGPDLLIKRFAEDKDASVRTLILQTMMYSGQMRTKGLALLKTALKDPSRDMRLTAASLLSNLGQQKDGLESLAIALHDVDPEVRVQAVYNAYGFGEAGVPIMVEAFKTAKDAPFRAALLNLLVNHNYRSKDLLPQLTDGLKDSNVQVRWTSAALLGNLGADARPALPALRELLADSSSVVQQHARSSIARIDVK